MTTFVLTKCEQLAFFSSLCCSVVSFHTFDPQNIYSFQLFLSPSLSLTV